MRVCLAIRSQIAEVQTLSTANFGGTHPSQITGTFPYVAVIDSLVWQAHDRTNGGSAGKIRQGGAFPDYATVSSRRNLDNQRKTFAIQYSTINVTGGCGGNSPVVRHEMHVEGTHNVTRTEYRNASHGSNKAVHRKDERYTR